MIFGYMPDCFRTGWSTGCCNYSTRFKCVSRITRLEKVEINLRQRCYSQLL